jgi:hypothetical protein
MTVRLCYGNYEAFMNCHDHPNCDKALDCMHISMKFHELKTKKQVFVFR